MSDLGTVITWLVGLWVASKLLPPMIDGFNKGMEQRQTRELVRQHPEHAVEIRKAARIQQARWEPAAAARKGGGMGKLVVVVLCLVYIVFPIDFIPDFIPVLGWGDDLVAAIIGLKALIK